MTGEDGMTLLYVPAGEFTMGSYAWDALAICQKSRNDCYVTWFTDEQPPHRVNLDAFWIDKTEVTNKMYSSCVDAGACRSPISKRSHYHSRYYGNADYDNYPVIYVDWKMAKTYCEWAGRRLPTEAEWEKAARGTKGSLYPWGDNAPNTSLLNFGNYVGDTSEVGKYPGGASLYGALDMAGNVWEWVSSLYESYPYDEADGRENLDSSDARVVRGGAWNDYAYVARSAERYRYVARDSNSTVGFRCAVSAIP
jgi:formylglycine-generating enzyme required for sulfatase activity